MSGALTTFLRRLDPRRGVDLVRLGARAIARRTIALQQPVRQLPHRAADDIRQRAALTRLRAETHASPLSFVLDPGSIWITSLAAGSVVAAILLRVAFGPDTRGARLDDAGNLFSDICVGYFAAWIVYYLTAWRPRREDRNRALVVAGPTLIGLCAMPQFFSVTRNRRKEATIDERTMAAAAIDVRLDDPVVRLNEGTRLPTHVETLQSHIAGLAQSLTRCDRVASSLDSTVLGAIANIENSSLVNTVRVKTLRGDKSWGWAFHIVPQLYDYALRCNALRNTLLPYRRILEDAGAETMFKLPPLAGGPLEWQPGKPCPWDEIQKQFDEIKDAHDRQQRQQP